MEMRNPEVERNVTNVATVRCAESCWWDNLFGHSTEEQLQKGWKTQTFQAKNWSRVRGSAGAVQGALRNLDVLWPSYRVIVLEEYVLDWKVKDLKVAIVKTSGFGQAIFTV